MSALLVDCPEARRDPLGEARCELGTLRRQDVETWLLGGRPETGPFPRWLEGRFTEAEIPGLLRKLARASDYAGACRVVALRLAEKLGRGATR